MDGRESSRPLLSRSGCIYKNELYKILENMVLVPFYRGAVVFKVKLDAVITDVEVLVPFYRGAVVFREL